MTLRDYLYNPQFSCRHRSRVLLGALERQIRLLITFQTLLLRRLSFVVCRSVTLKKITLGSENSVVKLSVAGTFFASQCWEVFGNFDKFWKSLESHLLIRLIMIDFIISVHVIICGSSLYIYWYVNGHVAEKETKNVSGIIRHCC